MKPNYMIIGSAKCGTTSLAYILGSHPEIFLTKPKEPRFFADDQIYVRGINWYESLYEPAGKAKMRGEASIHYTMKEIFPNCIPRLIKYTTNLKLIYIVRHPMDRILSLWTQCRANRGPEWEVHYIFKKALYINRNMLIDTSNYLEQIDVYRKHFSDDQILVVFFEDLKEQPRQVYRQCFEFLDVDPEFIPPKEVTHLNQTGAGTMISSLHSVAREFRPYQMLSQMMPENIRSTIREWSPIKRLLRTPQQKPEWDKESYEWTVDILGEPTRKFLTRYGKSPSFWNLTYHEE